MLTEQIRFDIINTLVIMTGKGEAYFMGMNDTELEAEYDRHMEVEG